MSIYDFLALLIIAVDITLGLYVIIKGPNRRLNWAFFNLVFSVGFWVFASWQAGIIRENLNIPLAWERMSFLGGTLIAVSMLRFVIILCDKKASLIFTIVVEYLVPMFFAAISLTPLILKDNTRSIIGYEPTYGIMWYFFIAYFIAYIISPIILLIGTYKKTSGIQHQKIKYILISILLAGGCGIVINLLIPLLINIGALDNNYFFQSLYHFSHFIAIIFIGFTAYAIVRYRLMDVRIVIRKSIIYAISLLFTLAIFTYLAIILKDAVEKSWNVSTTWTAVILIALVVLVFPPLKNLVEKAINTLFKGKKSIDLAVKELQEKITKKTDVGTLIELVSKEIKKFLEVDEAKLFIIDRQKKQFVWQDGEGVGESIDPRNDILRYFDKYRDVLIVEEIAHRLEGLDEPLDRERLQKAEKEMRKRKISLAMPLYTEDEVFGVILLGERPQGKAYTVEDVKYLEQLREQVSSVLAYALLYRDAMERIKVGAVS